MNQVEIFSLKNLLLVAGLLHFTQLPAVFMAPKMLNWKEDLAQLIPINRWIFKVIGGGIMFYALGSGVVVVCAAEEIAKGGGLATAFSGFLCLSWIYRGGVQVFLYSRIWPEGWLAKISHYFMSALFAFLTVVYGIAFFSGLMNGSQ